MKNKFLLTLFMCFGLYSMQAQVYCVPTYSPTGSSWRISQIDIPEISFAHTQASNTPHDHTATVIAVDAGDTYTFNITTNGWVGVGVAADFNQDGDFDDTDEILHPGTYIANDPATYNYSIIIPASVPTDTYRLRLWNAGGNSGGGDPNTTPCGSFGYGTYLDFTLSVTGGGGGSCAAPTNLVEDAVTDSTVDFSWDASPDEDSGYTWRVMEMGDDPETDTPVDQGTTATGVTSAQATGLMPETMYDVYVQTHCDMGVDSDFSTALSVETEAAPTCAPPTDVINDSVTETTATFSWTLSDSDADADGYVWAVFADGADPETDNPLDDDFVSSGVTTVEVAGLDDNTPYDFYMATLCDGSTDFISDIVGPINFTTDPLSLGNNAIPGLSLYPNPVADVINIDAPGAIQTVELFDLRGRSVNIQTNTAASQQWDLTALPQGLYLMKIRMQTGESGVYKLVKK